MIVDVAANSASYELFDKLTAYRRNGVQEYILWRDQDQAVDWSRLCEGRYSHLLSRGDGISRSQVFPGLLLDAGALLSGDLTRVHEVLAQWLASPEHAAFVERNASAMSG